jgi:hypothetical protein
MELVACASRRVRSQARRFRARLLLVLFASAVSLGCLGSMPTSSEHDAVFARGLSSCTEQCRPFGVLSFGFTVAPGGSVIYECECMPAKVPVEEEEPEEEEGDEEPKGKSISVDAP